MLEVKGLTVRYGQHRALEDVRLRVSKGEIVVILGANGAGKSTLLKSVCGICEGQVAGSVTLDGAELLGLAPNRIVEEGIALVPEGRGIFGELTVKENLLLGAYSDRARDSESGNLDRVYTLFPKLAERAGQVARTMSGGEQQMVAIGRAMMSNPALLALDEPSLGLSPILSKELFQSLARVRALGIGVLLVEQNARQSLAIADRGYLLENAHVVHEASARELLNDPAVQAAYLGAGGAASPRTHDDGAAPAPAETPRTVAPARRAAQSRSADAVLGFSVADLVSRAADRAKPQRMAAQPASTTGTLSRPSRPTVSTDGAARLKATLAEIEQAAERARNARAARTAAERPKPGPSDPAPASKSRPPDPAGPAKPVTVEVYRPPRVEVYRRRPGGSEFERD